MADQPFTDDEVRFAVLRVLEDRKPHTLNDLRGTVNRKRKKGLKEATTAQVMTAVTKLVSRRDASFDGTNVRFGNKR